MFDHCQINVNEFCESVKCYSKVEALEGLYELKKEVFRARHSLKTFGQAGNKFAPEQTLMRYFTLVNPV